MSYSAISHSFEYLCYGSTAIINSFTLYSAGIDFSRQILSTKVDLCAVTYGLQPFNPFTEKHHLIILVCVNHSGIERVLKY